MLNIKVTNTTDGHIVIFMVVRSEYRHKDGGPGKKFTDGRTTIFTFNWNQNNSNQKKLNFLPLVIQNQKMCGEKLFGRFLENMLYIRLSLKSRLNKPSSVMVVLFVWFNRNTNNKTFVLDILQVLCEFICTRYKWWLEIWSKTISILLFQALHTI